MTDGWTLRYEGFDPKQQGLRESLCTLGNGYFATRGAPTDAVADDTFYPGTYLAGGYNRLESEVAGRVVENEDLVNLPNWLPFQIRLGDGSWLGAHDLEPLDCRQDLDLAGGILHRRLRLREKNGIVFSWHERRLVSMACPHRAALQIQIVLENWSGRLYVRSGIDGSVRNEGVKRYRELADRHLSTLETRAEEDGAILLRSRTTQSRREIAVAARTVLSATGTGMPVLEEIEESQDSISQVWSIELNAGATLAAEKIVSLFDSRTPAITEPATAALTELASIGHYADLEAAHKRAWSRLWDGFDIQFDTKLNHQMQMKLRLHIFHLLQTVSFHSIDYDVGVPARGWHGEAYRGHIFWDELFIFPFINLRMPILTRSLLLYRFRRLPEARRAARRAGYAGAMFPWQSGSSGREETQHLHLNPMSGRWFPDTSHRQRHVNAAIAFNIWQYFEATEDMEFMAYHGAEMMLEISRFWASIATYDSAKNRYSINGVMGPDEFHTADPGTDPSEAAGLSNNAYTNVMASWCIMRTLDAVETLPNNSRQRLFEKLQVSAEELERWDRISRNLFVPFLGDGIIGQFEGYERLKELNWEDYRSRYENLQRMDRILESENKNPNEFQITKQADVLMLFFLFSAENLKDLFDRLGYPFSPDMIERNIRYYTQRTSHGSTLSWVTHAWILSRWDRSRSWRLFEQALDADFADLQGGTTAEGIHLGAMAGAVDLVQRCYTGMEVLTNAINFNPLLPEEIDCLRSRIHYRGQILDVTVTHSGLEISSHSCTAAPISIGYRGHVRKISPGQTYRFRLVRPTRKPEIDSNLAEMELSESR